MYAPIVAEPEVDVQEVGNAPIVWIVTAPAPTTEAGVLPEPGAPVFGDDSED